MEYNTYQGNEITDELLERCALLFSSHYGVWGNTPSGKPKPGQPVKLSGKKLRSQFICDPDRTVLAVCVQSEAGPVGHAFATTWDYDGGVVGWVTQLVVRRNSRRQYVATNLLQMLKTHPLFQSVSSVGLVSSHPAACNTLSKLSGIPFDKIDTEYCRLNAKKILASTPVDYLQNLQFRGSLFEENCTTGAVSSLDTSFYIDHAEPLEVLKIYQEESNWALGELLEGHEFLIILPFTPKAVIVSS